MKMQTEPMTGRVDVHSHLLPEVDDGCKSIADAIDCARALVEAGYTHAFCTPHVWPNLASVTKGNVPRWVGELQVILDNWNIPLRLLPGAEMNLHPQVTQTPEEKIISLAMKGRFILVDLWADRLPEHFRPAVRWLQEMGLTVILAHPERMRSVQDDPSLADEFRAMGLLLQGNLQCLGDPPDMPTRRVAERYLKDGRYFLLGSDTHNPGGLPGRLEGLQNAIAMVGQAAVDQLTIDHPRLLME